MDAKEREEFERMRRHAIAHLDALEDALGVRRSVRPRGRRRKYRVTAVGGEMDAGEKQTKEKEEE